MEGAKSLEYSFRCQEGSEDNTPVKIERDTNAYCPKDSLFKPPDFLRFGHLPALMTSYLDL